MLYYVFILAVAEESSDDVSGSKGAPAVDILNKS